MSTLRRVECWLGALALGVGLVVASAPAAQGQENFRVTYSVDRSDPARTRVSGVVFNEARADVLDVYVTVEAVDGARKVIARGITFVSPSIPQGGSAPFDAAVPAPPSAASFRVRVTRYHFGLGIMVAPQTP